MLHKFSGILDKVQPTLATDVWTKDWKLIPEIHAQIISILKKIVPIELVDRALILGSITGYKYTSDSDIDINVVLKETINKDEARAVHLKTRKYNGISSIGGSHPINFFIRPYYPPGDWSYSIFGVYDLFNGVWKKFPIDDPSVLRDPQDKFVTELITAKMFANRFADMVNSLYLNNLSLEGLSGRALKLKQKEIEHDIQSLLEEEKRIHSERDVPYNSGWGVPRNSFRNIVYKLIEHGQYGGVMEALKSIRHSEKTL